MSVQEGAHLGFSKQRTSVSKPLSPISEAITIAVACPAPKRLLERSSVTGSVPLSFLMGSA